ncbi:MAG: dihydropyrimidinase [Anaerolineaceae bacterium]|nr:dihydropyrimidinase [Anaerolineaceae bacterium]
MENFDLVIRGGKLVTDQKVTISDLGIRNGKIAAVGLNLLGKETIDANGFLVLPGGIDPHVHFQMPTATTMTSDDWFSGTRAAACGGTTTVIDFVEPEMGESLSEALRKRQAEAERNCWIDYALHMTIHNVEPKTLQAMEYMQELGITSFKVYTTYEGMKLNQNNLRIVFEKAASIGGLCMVHAEADDLIQQTTAQLIKEKKTDPSWFPESRPAQAEIEAVINCIKLTANTNLILYVVHLSTSAAIELVDQARKDGKNIIAETCPQYLLLNKNLFTNNDQVTAASLICSPPLREAGENQAIWSAVDEEKIQSVGSDHCSFTIDPQKRSGLDDFRKVPGGLPGVELRLPLLYTFGVRAGHLNLTEWVRLCSSQPAKIFGLYPQKGSLTVGADADIVLFDPEKEVVVQQTMLHENVDYTPYAGLKLTGYPVMTIVKGNVLVKDGELVSEKKTGSFLKCNQPEFV